MQKITRDGQLCRKCGTPVVKRKPEKLKRNAEYHCSWYLVCP